MSENRVEGVIVQPDGMGWAKRRTLVRLAAERRRPAIYPFKEDAEAGVSYGANILEMQAQGSCGRG